MRTSPMRIAMAGMALGALTAAAALEASPAYNQPPEPGSRKNKPGGNTPVPGGGAKERARRMARMSTQEIPESEGPSKDKLAASPDAAGGPILNP